MSLPKLHPPSHPVWLWLLCAHVAAQAQDTQSAELPSLTATGQVASASDTRIGGFEASPAWQQPMQAVRLGERKLKDARVSRLNDVSQLDASVGNQQGSAGYLEALSIRGFVLAPLSNYRRDGLPLAAETRLALDNVAAVELLKGTSGIQAGTSSPGGLINLVIKRPQGRIRQAEWSLSQHGNLLSSLDLGDEFRPSPDEAAPAVGLRLNLAHERLHPSWDNGQGERHQVALAADTMLGRDTHLEVEMDHSRHVQASQPGVSMTGLTLPSARDVGPDFNVNTQRWSQPVRNQNTAGSLRLNQTFNPQWRGSLHYGQQRTHTDDRDVFGFAAPGCLYGVDACDRFASNGDHLVVRYDSLGERRHQRALDAHVDGQLPLGDTTHQFTAGATRSLLTRDLPTALQGPVGVSNLYAPQDVPADTAGMTAQNSARQRNMELYLRDHAQWGEARHAWLGLRHTRMQRHQFLSDGSQASRLTESFTTPWAALGWSWAPGAMAYASWGQGVEVLPVRFSSATTTVVNNGEALPAAKSRQWELGLQAESTWGQWRLAWFHVTRPEANLLAVEGQPNATRLARDGDSQHRGLEARWQARWQAYSSEASLMWLDAQRRGSAQAAANGQAPLNVPDYAWRWSQQYRWAVQRGLTWQLDLMQDGPRTADLLTGTRLPAWLRCDTSLKLAQSFGDTGVVWALGVRNVMDTRAWRESPTTSGHIYLLPLPPREWTASASVSF